MSKLLVVALSFALSAAVFAEDEGTMAIKATFAGYENDDLVFNVTNEEIFNIEVKGISFRGQILYRPLQKNQLVPALTEEEPSVVKFRSNGDYVWSENHMDKFKMAYVIAGSSQRQYADIYPQKAHTNP